MEKSSVDILWLIVSSALVFVMRAGFAMLESGLVRTKNSINVSVKVFSDLGISFLTFWGVGFGIMFGVSHYGFTGASLFAPSTSTVWFGTFFLFHAMFASTSAVIVSGAVAERIKYSAYLMTTLIFSAVIYPIVGHWVWNTGLFSQGQGWLAKLGFVDFAGSTAVHSVGGWMSLAVIMTLGPRIGRYNRDGSVNRVTGSNTQTAVVGTILLWFGWIGFNGGSTLGMSADVPSIIVKTSLSGAAGMVVTLLVGWRLRGYADVGLLVNGALAGLVAITAACPYVSELTSVLLGSIGGIVMLFVEWFLDRLRIDDAVGAVPVHLGAGIWGTIATGLFGNLALMGTHHTRMAQIGIQLLGVAAAAAWAFGLAFFLVSALNRFFPIRVSAKSETEGLNISEHRASTEIYDLSVSMGRMAETGDISHRAHVEPFTEIGQIAAMYNGVMDKLELNTVARGDYVSILDNVSDGLFLIDKDGLIAKHYSAACETLFNRKKIAGEKFVTLIDGIIDSSVKSAFEDYLPLLFDANKQQRLVDKLNPLGEVELMFGGLTGEFASRHYQFHFHRVMKDGVVRHVMVLVRDVTRQKELAQEVEQTRRRIDEEMELFYGIIHVEPGTLAQFLDDAAEDLESINNSFADPSSDPAELISGVFRRAHAIKGDADMLGLEYIANKAHELENAAKTVSQKKMIANDDFLQVTIILSEIRTSIGKIKSVIERWSGAHVAARTEMNPNDYFTGALGKLVNRLAERHGKKAEISFSMEGIDRMGGRDRKRMREILVQLVRNSMYHGIETPDERKRAGKSAAGSITVSASENDGTLTIRYRDDGRGLDGEKILRKAVERGIITEDQSSSMTEREAYPLIFRENFSTADGTDLTAGRGVGMALVKNLVSEAGGRITLRSRGGEYLEFDIAFPFGGSNAV